MEFGIDGAPTSPGNVPLIDCMIGKKSDRKSFRDFFGLKVGEELSETQISDLESYINDVQDRFEQLSEESSLDTRQFWDPRKGRKIPGFFPFKKGVTPPDADPKIVEMVKEQISDNMTVPKSKKEKTKQ